MAIRAPDGAKKGNLPKDGNYNSTRKLSQLWQPEFKKETCKMMTTTIVIIKAAEETNPASRKVISILKKRFFDFWKFYEFELVRKEDS